MKAYRTGFVCCECGMSLNVKGPLSGSVMVHHAFTVNCSHSDKSFACPTVELAEPCSDTVALRATAKELARGREKSNGL